MLTRNQKRAQLLLVVAAAVCGLLTVVFVLLSLQAPGNRSPTAAVSEWMPVSLFATGTLFFLSTLAFRAHTGKIASLRASAISFSLLALLALGNLWWLLDKAERWQRGVGTAVQSAADTESYLKDNLPPGRDPLRVRTGVFVQSFDFRDANTVEATGYIWQRYPADTPKDLVRGFALPEAAGTYEVTEAYRGRDNRTGEETIGWQFNPYRSNSSELAPSKIGFWLSGQKFV